MAGSRNDVQYEQWQIHSRSKTASYSVAGQDSRDCFNNLGATGSVTFTLPKAKGNGVEYYFLVATSQFLIVAPQSTDLIRGKAAGLSYSSSTQGNVIYVCTIVPGIWDIFYNNGFV